jgi:4-amino-4-deoxy-L-arabinose transferase-like glycosyltransferase
LIVFAGSAWVAVSIMEGVPHLEDEVAYLFQAQVFARGRLYVPSPETPDCFFGPFVLDHEGRRFGKYPPGWPGLLALGVAAGQPWWVNAALASVTLALVFRLAQDVHNARTAALAAILATTSPFLMLLSGSLMSHTACAAFISAFLWCFARSQVREDRVWALAAGAALGAAALIRPFTSMVIAVPAALISVWRWIKCGAWRLGWFMLLGFVPLALLLPVMNAIWTGDPFLSPYVLFWPYDRLGFGPGHGVLEQGNTLWLGLGSAVISIGRLATHLLGWPALSLVFVVLLFVYAPRNGWDLFLVATALSLILGYVLYWTNGDVFGPRYILESAPALLILTAAGILRVVQRLSARRRRLLWGAVSLLVLINLTFYLPGQLSAYRGLYGITAAPRSILQEAGLSDALVIVRDDRGWKDYAVAFVMNEPTYDGEVVYANECESRDALLARYQGRSVYYFDGQHIERVR